jgi:hypothetical protein
MALNQKPIPIMTRIRICFTSISMAHGLLVPNSQVIGVDEHEVDPGHEEDEDGDIHPGRRVWTFH